LGSSANYGDMKRDLDVKVSDLEKSEVLTAFKYAGTAGNLDIIGLSDVSEFLGTDEHFDVGTVGELYNLKDQSGVDLEIRDSVEISGAAIKQKLGTMIAGVWNPYRFISTDRANSGDFIAYENETLVVWDTNNTGTNAETSRTNIAIFDERTNDGLDYIIVKRYMTVQPTITLDRNTVTLVSPTNNSVITTSPYSFTANLNSTSYNWTNGTFSFWYSNGSLLSVNNVNNTNVTNHTQIAYSLTPTLGTYYWTAEATAVNTSVFNVSNKYCICRLMLIIQM